MAVAQRLDIRQGVGLVMTPQLQQAIKLLQLSNAEICQYVETELERNPALERVEDSEQVEIEAPTEIKDSGQELGEISFSAESGDANADSNLDASFEDVYNDADMPAASINQTVSDWGHSSRSNYEDIDGIEDNLTAEISLHDHLEAQASLAFSNPAEKMMAVYLIDYVDDAGYLHYDKDEVLSALGIDEKTLEKIVQTLQTFDPSGVCARNVEECLSAQLREKDRLDPAMQKMLANLDLLAKRDLKSLSLICEVDGEDIAEMISEIRALTPKPGAAFGSVAGSAIVPDVFVKEAPFGGWHVEVNSESLPRVLVNNSYCEFVSNNARTTQEKSFITECQNDANWLVKSLDQRARTILKVAREIVRRQDAFLTYGVSHLRPLSLKDVASAIEMHESTVSRVTSNKYMATPRGVFELKYFFTTAISSSYGGDSHSSESVRHQIKNLIDEESRIDPLSDDAIVEMLRETGIDIARRTVAKYREAMRIPSSVQRRREGLLAHG